VYFEFSNVVIPIVPRRLQFWDNRNQVQNTKAATSIGVSLILPVFALAAAGVKQPSATGRLKEFDSAKYQFSVRYPDSWYQAAGVTEMLDITNFLRDRPDEVIARRVGGAEVTVSAARPEIHSVTDWVNRDVPDDASVLGGSPVEQADIPVGAPPANGCVRIRRVSWREEIAPNAYFARTMYYCSTTSRVFRIALTNWDGDSAQSHLRELALQIALSLRTQ
jgi:hypothetical protein